MIPRLSVPRSVKAAPLQPTIKRMAAAGSSAAPQPTAKKPAGNTSAGVVKKSPASGLKAKGMPAAQANKPAPAAKPNKAAPPALKSNKLSNLSSFHSSVCDYQCYYTCKISQTHF